MKKILFAGMILTAALSANAAPKVSLPQDLTGWTHYASIPRGGMTEDLYVSGDLSKMASGQPFPYGTKILLIENTGPNSVRRYIVMQKEPGWARTIPLLSETANGSIRPTTGTSAPSQKLKTQLRGAFRAIKAPLLRTTFFPQTNCSTPLQLIPIIKTDL